MKNILLSLNYRVVIRFINGLHRLIRLEMQSLKEIISLSISKTEKVDDFENRYKTTEELNSELEPKEVPSSIKDRMKWLKMLFESENQHVVKNDDWENRLRED